MRIFLSGLETTLGHIYDATDGINKIYPAELCGDRINRLAQKFAQKAGIKKRSSVLDLDRFPEVHLLQEEYHPANWGAALFEKVVPTPLLNDIGHILTLYNISAHKNILPSISAQIAHQLSDRTTAFPIDIPYLGCAAALFAIQQASDLVQKTEKAVFVYVFDQCTSRLVKNYDIESHQFRSILKTNILFSDGAAAFLIVPESLHHLIKTPQIEILDTYNHFVYGEEIYVDDKVFVLGDRISEVVPETTSEFVIKPLLKLNGLHFDEIEEWSIHQGGKEILTRFGEPEILGLMPAQLEPSLQSFYQFGNFSSPSCLFVLKRFFDQQALKPQHGKLGMIAAFGAGYYLGASLYRWYS